MLAPDTLLQRRYRIVGALGQGGMGAVYEAIDLRLDTHVAVKQTLAGLELNAAFEREARLLASLRHPALPAVSDYFAEQDSLFLVMQLIPGADLIALLAQRQNPFDVAQVLNWADQILDALEYLHNQQPAVVHRDIKPHNLKLTPGGGVVLLDFGLAKGRAAAVGGATSLFGYTPHYAPLEQIQGDHTDQRSDLFALAATLYHLLTGRQPPDALRRAGERAAGRPDPLDLPEAFPPHIPAPVAALLRQTLALDPARRPADASALRHMLRQVSLDDATLAGPAAGAPVASPSLAGDLTYATASVPHNLPAQPTALIGRERERLAVAQLIGQPEVRLVTLTGPGGIGKTRLALQAAADLLDNPLNPCPDGAFLVQLAPIRDPDLVVPTIAQALGVLDTSALALADALKAHLRDRRLLLLLDNFEQVAAAAPAVADLLAAAPRLRVLITSRGVLRLSGEHDFPVPPLALPPSTDLPSLDTLVQSESVSLFVARARAVKPDFKLTPANATAVARICVQLDGLPLAIELAAARSRLLTPPALLERLSSRLKLLTGGARDLPLRQQTLRGAIDWSYDLLEPPEQQVFRRLAVFVGGRTLEAAEAVCDADGSLPISVLDALQSLLDKSLLYEIEAPDGTARLLMLSTIWEYAQERLEASGDADIFRRAHAEYYLRLAEAAAAELIGANQGEWLDRLEVEHDNMRAALGWAEQHNPELAVRLAGALWRFWQMRGHLGEGRRWMRAALRAGVQADPAIRTTALNGAGNLAWFQGDYDEAQQLHEAALALRRALGDTRGMASSLNNLGNVAWDQGDFPRATALYEQSLALWREVGDAWGVAGALNNLGNIAWDYGDAERATALYEQSLALERELGDTQGIATTLGNLGEVAYKQGNSARAIACYEESLELERELGDRQGMATTLYNLGDIACGAGDERAAVARFEESLAIQREVGDKKGEALVLRGLGRLTRDQGDGERARSLFLESLELCRSLGLKREIGDCLDGLASIAGMAGQPRRAALLFAAAEALRADLGYALSPADRSAIDRQLVAIRSQLGEAGFGAAWQAGRTMSLAQACTRAEESE